ncbi:putative thioredoxin [Cryobacterium mesophilum]|uniref:Tetratricopeptide repeat protein n=1 Tax=Terrimesophilobacter mesophilus TaxID=433647 RepID=A0A4R8V9T9_9MICO|nr:tetratricopeptide repeat protein [Terrimesophilobacter mesophilus]MBB5632467.1 putative thioredoxin [Terrimesophilobacter mesophilus]TFB79295.1 tetratricopeptide repeat protein [Terrimesophilobacter mesophilus]
MTDIPPTQLRGAVDLSSLLRDKPERSTASGTAGDSAIASLVTEGTDANFGQFLELSRTIAVIVELHAGEPSATLERIIRAYEGRFVLVTVDARRNPQLTQAFQAVAVPTVAAVVGGRPIALYEGELAEADAKGVFDQVVTLATQNGVTGKATTSEAKDEAPAEPVEEPLPPHHQAAFDAIDRGDFATAIAEYKTAIAQDPRDQLAVAGLVQVSLLHRLDGAVADDIRATAAASPGDLDAQLAVADLDISGGHVDDACGRLLDLFPSLDQHGKDVIRTRLLSYFDLTGSDDPRVAAARRRLTSLLY